MKTELEDFIHDNRDAFFSRTPDPSVLQKIQEKMHEADRKKKEKVPVISLRLRWAVAASVILLTGLVSFLALRKTDDNNIAAVTPKKVTRVIEEPKPNPLPIIEENTTKESSEDINTVKYEAANKNIEQNYSHKTSLFEKLRNDESPSERFEAASKIESITKADNDIVDALAKTMNTDPNTNVRLAALDALSKFYREPYVKKTLLTSLPKQKDPMVQIALIELLTNMKEASILKQLNKMVNDENTIQPVKDQAYAGILTLRS